MKLFHVHYIIFSFAINNKYLKPTGKSQKMRPDPKHFKHLDLEVNLSFPNK